MHTSLSDLISIIGTMITVYCPEDTTWAIRSNPNKMLITIQFERISDAGMATVQRMIDLKQINQLHPSLVSTVVERTVTDLISLIMGE